MSPVLQGTNAPKPKPSKSRGVDADVDTGIEMKVPGAGRVLLATVTRTRL
jgi:hypothetical protein